MVSIKEIDVKDTPLLNKFLSRAGNSLTSFRYFQKRPKTIIGQHIVTYIIEDNDIPVCYGHLDPENGRVWLGIAVAEDAQGKGYGSMMMDKLISSAREKGLREIFLTVDNGNRIAIKLYKKKGFVRYGMNEKISIYSLLVGVSKSIPESGGDKLPVSAIVCTFNEEKRIGKCIESIVNNRVKEIICVDGVSADDTVKIASRMGAKIVSDNKQGLIKASQIGAETASEEYIIFVGPDNILPPGIVKRLIDDMRILEYAGISPLTEYTAETKGFISSSLVVYKRSKFDPGPSSVVGTPCMFRRMTFLKYGFDLNNKWLGDSDLCGRMLRDGLRIGRVGICAYESGYNDLKSIYNRWIMYGLSDGEYFRKFSPGWGGLRKMRSIIHPIRSDLISVLSSDRVTFLEKMEVLPFLFVIVLFRYLGWIKYSRRDLKRA
jgi:glycosyltransferase involved in cell wall biosynthesis/GNAT superfamily N-acetyltransferase